MSQIDTYAKGDWVAHSFYGIGQILGIEVKKISGKQTEYYRIKTNDSTFWSPTAQTQDAEVRLLATPTEIKQAIASLQETPTELPSNAKIRQTHIQKAQQHNTVVDIALLVRDLHAHIKAVGAQSVSEKSLYKDLRQRLIQEWAIVMDKQPEQVATNLDKLLTTT